MQEAYPITYGVLGLLALSGPMSGYDLKQAFDLGMTPIWNAAHSQIYNELRRMTELGWATMERLEQSARPDKKLYRITAAGEEALRSWQASGPARGLQMRDEVLLRFVFGSFADPAALAGTLRAAIADHRQRLAQYEYTLSQCLPPAPGAPAAPAEGEAPAYAPDPFFVETARFGLRLEQTYLQWLGEALAFAEARAGAA